MTTITKKTMLLPLPTTITNVTSQIGELPEGETGVIYAAENVNVYGTNLKLAVGDSVGFSGTLSGSPVSGTFALSAVPTNTNEKLVLYGMGATTGSFEFDNNSTVKLTVKGVEVSATYKVMR